MGSNSAANHILYIQPPDNIDKQDHANCMHYMLAYSLSLPELPAPHSQDALNPPLATGYFLPALTPT